jgi:hypothetical protein
LVGEESVGRVGGCDHSVEHRPPISRAVGHRGHSKPLRREGQNDPPPPTQPFGRLERNQIRAAGRRTNEHRGPLRGHVRYSELAADRFKDFWRD